MERQQQPPPETFDFKIKFAETKAHAKVRKVCGSEGALPGLNWYGVLGFRFLGEGVLCVVVWKTLAWACPRSKGSTGARHGNFGALSALAKSPHPCSPHRQLRWN